MHFEIHVSLSTALNSILYELLYSSRLKRFNKKRNVMYNILRFLNFLDTLGNFYLITMFQLSPRTLIEKIQSFIFAKQLSQIDSILLLVVMAKFNSDLFNQIINNLVVSGKYNLQNLGLFRYMIMDMDLGMKVGSQYLGRLA